MRGDLTERLHAVVEAYKAMPPVEQALHDAAQRRSFVRGQCGADPGPDVLAEEVLRLRALLADQGKDGWEPIETAPRDGTRVLGWIVYRGELDYSLEPFERISVIAWDEGCSNPGWEREAAWHKEWIGEPIAWRPIEGPNGRLEAEEEELKTSSGPGAEERPSRGSPTDSQASGGEA